jgi:putative hemolysin
MTEILGSVGLVLLFILIGGVFAAAEIALVTLREGQIRALAERGPRGQRVADLASNPNRFLAAVQIGITLAGFLSAAFGEAKLSGHLEPIFIDAGMSAGLADVVALIVITVIVSYFALVFGELSPKRLALQRGEGIALVVARPLDRLARMARPAIWLLSASTNLVVRVLGGNPAANREQISEEELRGLVAAHETLSVDERALIDEVFSAGVRQLSEVMVPRTEVEFLEGSMTVSRAARQVADSPHSRYPVTGDNQDDVVGFVHIRDLYAPNHPAGRAATVLDLAREVKRMPGSKKVLPALSEMRHEGHHMAIVVDEYGGTDGIVTLEDLIEEIIGDIRDEYDERSVASPPSPTGEIDVDGLLNLDDFADATGVRLPEGPYETAAGYVINELGRLALAGDTVEVDGRRIEVLEMDGRRVDRLRVYPPPDEEDADLAATEPADDSAQLDSSGS